MSDERKPAKPVRGLGRGLSALLGDDATAPAAARGERQVAIEHIHRSRFQPRRNFDPEQLNSLAESIRAQGVLQPLLVRPHPEKAGEFEIVAGERRWRAAQLARLSELPVVTREVSDRDALELALVENVQRQDLNPIEEGRGYLRLIEEFGHTQDDIARATGKSRPHIANTMRLLMLPEEVIAMVEDGRLTAGHARPLIGHDQALAIAEDVVKRGLSVRQVEGRLKPRPEHEAGARAPSADPNLRALERELESLLGLKARIEDLGRDGGSITFSYANLDQLDDFLKRLGLGES
jgi:ParB family transcriptional regulator, chromosome partitioning protein